MFFPVSDQKTALPNVLPQMVHDRNNITKRKTCIVPARRIIDVNCQLSNFFGDGGVVIVFYFSDVCEYINMYYG